MANNRIPRNAKKIYITWRIATTGNAAGDHATVEKTERGWIETTASGKQYLLPPAILRNGEAVQIDQIETDTSTDVLLINAGVQVYIIDGSRRTDEAALALIAAMENAGRIAPETAERAKNDRRTLDKIKMTMNHYHMETRETATGARWTFSSASGVVLDIPAYEANYIRADKQGNLYPVEAPTTPETVTGKEDTTTDGNSAQEATETAQKTTEGKTTDGAHGQEAPTDGQTPTAGDIEPHRATENAITAGKKLYSHPHRHIVTVDGIEGDLVRVIYRGKLYLVSPCDLYTDETETEPAQMETAAARLDTDHPTPPPMEENHTEPRKACEIAQERTERGTAEQIPTKGRKTPYRAKLRAARRRSEIPRIEENRIFGRLSYPHFAGTSYPHRGYPWGGLPPQKNNAI